MKKLVQTLFYCGCLLLLSACAGSYQPQSFLNGQIHLADSKSYPSNRLHIQIRLLELNAQKEIQGIVAEQYINKPTALPIKFSLYYDQNAIKASSIYMLEASLYVDGRLTMQMASPQPLSPPLPSDTSVELFPVQQPH